MLRRVVLFLVLALAAFPGVASAKGPVEVSVCGASECASFGKPFRGISPFGDGVVEPVPAAAPGPYYRVVLSAEGERWTIFYVPETDSLALPDREWVNWERLEGPAAPTLRRLIRGLEPLPAPDVTQARANGRLLPGDPGSYLSRLDAGTLNPAVGSGSGIRLRLTGTASPWTNVDLLYYPERQSRADEGGSRVPWVGAGLVVAALLAATAVVVRRRPQLST